MTEVSVQYEALTDLQRRMIAALCQAGGRRVGRALRDLLGAEASHIEIFDAGVLQLGAAISLLDSGQHNLVGILFDLSGRDAGHLSMVLPERGALLLVSQLLPGPSVLDAEGVLRPEAASALLEVGNIVASAFLNAIADAVHSACLPSPPMLVHEASAALGARIGAGTGSETVLAISFEAQLRGQREPLAGGIFFAPDHSFLQVMLGDSAAAPPRGAPDR